MTETGIVNPPCALARPIDTPSWWAGASPGATGNAPTAWQCLVLVCLTGKSLNSLSSPPRKNIPQTVKTIACGNAG